MGSLPTNPEVRSVVVDPRNPKRVYAGGPAGVFRSDDAGRNWSLATQGIGATGVTALALDPANPDRLYAAAADGQLYRTEDGGTSWQPLSR